MQRKPLFLVLAMAVLLITACGRNDQSSGLAVPKDAAIVVHLNTPSLSAKLSWQEIKQTNWFKEMYEKADDSLAKKLMDDPANSGINTDMDLVYFMKRNGQNGYIAFEGLLKDPAAFEAFTKKISDNASSSKSGDINIVASHHGVATWMGNRFVFLADAPFGRMGKYYAPPMSDSDSLGQNENAPPAGYPTDSLVKFAKEIYELKGDNNLENDRKYASLLKEKGDVHFWMNAEPMYGDMLSGALSMMKFSTLLQGNISTATVSFDNGKISASSRSYYNSELAKVYEKYRMKNLDADALSRIPSQNIVGVFTMNYPPEGLKEFLKVIGVDGFVNGFLGQNGYSMDEFVKANKGDVLFSVSDFEVKPQTAPVPSEGGGPSNYERKEPSMKVLFGVSINDKPAFDKLIGVAKGKLGDMQGPRISYELNDKWFAAGTSEEQVKQFVHGGGPGNKQPFIARLTGHPAGFYLDIQKVLKPLEASTGDSSSRVALNESLRFWEDVVATGGELKDGAILGNFEVNLVDKNTNSLKQLNQYADRMAATRKRGF